jgi:hypothetical protein
MHEAKPSYEKIFGKSYEAFDEYLEYWTERELTPHREYRMCKYEDEHCDLFREATLPYPPDYTDHHDELVGSPIWEHLDNRLKEIVYYAELTEAWPEDYTPQFMGGNLSLKWLCNKGTRNCWRENLPGLTCKSIVLARVSLGIKGRKMVILPGYALLHLQGWPGLIPEEFKMNNKLTTAMAGNAFNGHQFLKVFLSMVAKFPEK